VYPRAMAIEEVLYCHYHRVVGVNKKTEKLRKLKKPEKI
jgi:hypothetical protein